MKERNTNLVHLGDLCDISTLRNTREDLPFVGLEDIQSGTGLFVGSKEPRVVRSTTYFFSGGQLLFGKLRPYLNKVLLPDFEGHCSTEIIPFNINPKIDKKYLFYWITSDEVVKEISKTSTGARMPRANISEVMLFTIPLPPLPEQQRIVAILDEAFAAIAIAKANTEKNVQNARELFETYLDNVFENPVEGWEERKIVEVCEIGDGNHGGNYPKKTDLRNTGIPFIRSINIVNGKISEDLMKFISIEKHRSLRKGHLRTGDVLFTNRGEIGKSAIVDEKYDDANLNSQIAFFRCSNQIVNKYLFYFLQSSEQQKLVKKSQTGTALQQFTITQIEKITIKVPSYKNQKETVEKLDALDNNIQNLQSVYLQKLDYCEELRNTIMKKAFNGEFQTR